MFIRAGESRLPPGFDIWFNGERVRRLTVLEADDETGRIVRVRRDAQGRAVLAPKGDSLVFDTEIGRVEFRPVSSSGASPEDVSPSA